MAPRRREAFALLHLGAAEEEEEEEEQGGEEEGGAHTHPGPGWGEVYCLQLQLDLKINRIKGAEVNVVIANGTQLESALRKRREPREGGVKVEGVAQTESTSARLFLFLQAGAGTCRSSTCPSVLKSQ